MTLATVNSAVARFISVTLVDVIRSYHESGYDLTKVEFMGCKLKIWGGV